MNIRKHICFFWIFQITYIAFAQQTDSTGTNSKWKMSFLASRNYSYRTVHTIKNSQPQTNPDKSYKTNDQIYEYGYHACFLISKKVYKNIYFETGLLLDNKGYKSEKISDTTYNPSWSGTFYTIKNHTIAYHFTSLGLPLFFEYNKKIYKKLHFETDLGISFNFVQRVKIEYSDTGYILNSYLTGGRIQQCKLMLYGKVGLLLKCKEGTYISLSPTCSYFLTKYHDWYTIDGGDKDLNLYSAGLELGIHFDLGRNNNKKIPLSQIFGRAFYYDKLI